ncbi:hypothetical protein [Wolbachia sp. wLmal]|uniref:hypothetical protein n=1 Tax=Wolbachia sp. wLmal TaxID=3342489 RepID=UPI003C2E0562
MQQKIKSCIGARIDVKVSNNVKDSDFVSKYVEYHNNELLERRENDQYYYNPKKDSSNIEEEIRKCTIWNMQSVRNRMTLACMDSDQAREQLKECLWKEKESSKIGEFLYKSKLGDSTSTVKEKLLGQFGKENEEAIDRVLRGIDCKGSIVDSGTFAVGHGIINNVISCITQDKLDKDKFEGRLSELDNQRFSNMELFREKVKKAIAKLNDQEAHKKIEEYVKGLNIDNYSYECGIISAMETVWKVLKNGDEKRLNELLDNHNLSKEIHKMMPPDLGSIFVSRLSNVGVGKGILDILEKNRSAFFRYLKEHYEVDGMLAKIEGECDTLYQEYKKAKDEANEYDRKELEPAKSKFREARRRHITFKERIDKLKKGIEKAKGADQETVKEMRKQLQEAEGKLEGLQSEEAKARGDKDGCQFVYDGKECKAKEKERGLISKFREIIIEFQSEEKYPLRSLRKICEKLSVCEAKGKDACAGDKLSRVGLIGYYFNWERKSGYNNQVLHNVLMRETVEDNTENKKQCIGRGGRKNGPIISLSYVDSAKIKSCDKVKGQLIDGDPFDSLEEVKHKIDTKKYAERIVKGIEKVVDSKYPKEEIKFINEEVYDALIKGAFECILGVRKEIYDRSGYSVEANKCFYQVLKSATSALKKQLDQRGIVVGDCEIELRIKILENKIGDLLEKHENSSRNIQRKQEEKDKVSNKLKIEGNFLKVIIIKFCTLVLRLWYWRFTLDKSQVEEVLKKEDKLTFKERVGLIREENKIQKEEAALQKVHDKQESEMEDLKKEKIDLQKQYNKIHQLIGIKAIKGNVEHREITKGYKERTKTEQLKYIESELKEVQSRLGKNKKDVDMFNELNSNTTSENGNDMDVAILECRIVSLRVKLENIVREHEGLAKIKNTLVNLRKSIIGDFSADDQNLLKDRMKQITESLHNCKLIDGADKDKIKDKIDDLYATGKSKEQNNKLAQDIFEQLLSYANASWIGKNSVGQKGTKGGKTKFERLYNTINHKIENLSIAHKGLQYDLGDVQSLLKYFDNFANGKTRFEKIKEEQERLQKEAWQLEAEKKMLKTNDKKQMDICRRLKVFESINKNYDVGRIVWLGMVLDKFFPKLNEKDLDLKMGYICSPLFLELFANIVAPLANDGNLKIALDMFDDSGNSSKDGADKICKFYQSLLNKDESFIRDNIDNVLANTVRLCLLIVSTKLCHHANAFSKDLELISSLTFGIVDPIELFVNDNASYTTNNEQKNILQGIAGRLFSRNSTTGESFNLLKRCNFIGTGIRGDQFNTGAVVFSTLNVIMGVLAAVKGDGACDRDDQNSMSNKVLGFLGDSSIRRAEGEIARLGKGVHKEVAEKYIYEYLEILRAGLSGRNYCISQQPDDLPKTSLNTCHVQKLSEDYKKASQSQLPASSIASPDIERLDRVSTWVKLGG